MHVSTYTIHDGAFVTAVFAVPDAKEPLVLEVELPGHIENAYWQDSRENAFGFVADRFAEIGAVLSDIADQFAASQIA